MKDLLPHDRPREKLSRHGAAALGDNELLALVIGQGSREADALALANRVLAATGGVHGLTRVHRDELTRLGGLGIARASRILAAVELGRRTLLRRSAERPLLASPREVAAHLMPLYSARPVEQFGIVLLDARHRLLRTTLLTVGTVDSSLVHPREVFREAAAAGAAALVLFHNHPSGDPAPSQEDERLTRRMVAAGQLMGIDVLDHVILADNRYVSFRERGQL